jgi:tetraacyldisaccharide 4'-kinase
MENGGAIAPSSGPAIAVAGIAHPAEFFNGVRASGWTVAREQAFRDHHPYSRGDVSAIFSAARDAGAAVVLTTEKDFVRLLPFRPFPVPVAYVPLTVEIEPRAVFDEWLTQTVDEARR